MRDAKDLNTGDLIIYRENKGLPEKHLLLLYWLH